MGARQNLGVNNTSFPNRDVQMTKQYSGTFFLPLEIVISKGTPCYRKEECEIEKLDPGVYNIRLITKDVQITKQFHGTNFLSSRRQFKRFHVFTGKRNETMTSKILVLIICFFYPSCTND